MEIKPLKNPACGGCKKFAKRYGAYYLWTCGRCDTSYRATRYRCSGMDKEWFEYEQVSSEMPPMGVSQWLEYGKKYGYYDYFKKLVEKEKLSV